MPETILQISYFSGSSDSFDQFAEVIQTLDFTVKLNHIKTKTKLKDALENDQCHLIVGSSKVGGADVFDVASMVDAANKTIPVVGLFDNTDISVEEAMRKGLNDYVDVSNRQHLQLVIQRELKHASLTQQLLRAKIPSHKDFTGLLSRLNFLEYLEQNLTQRISRSDYVAILYLQLDNFSWINESLGISSGDTFLKDIAKIIDGMIEETDLAARYQGGSFVILAEASSLTKLQAKADVIRESIGESISNIDDNSISSSCSIGIRLLIEDDLPIEEIISNAFEASETAKGNGGDAVHLFKNIDEIENDDQEKHAWNTRIKAAFENDMFLLFFQPIVSLRGDIKPRYEVLLRMIDDDSNIIAPGAFLPFAERSGLMADIDRRVIIQAFESAVKEKEKGYDTELFIKLSGKSLDDKSMANWIRNTLKEFDIDHGNIVFEITESLALSHLSQTRRMIDNLRKMQCKVAIDHFGTCLKSFKLFNLIDFDYLKIDGSLVSNLRNNVGHQTIVKKILRLSKKNNIPIMAEAVQDVDNLPIIWQSGFQFVQGYFLQIPDESMDYDFSNLLI